MKKFILALALALLASVGVQAQQPQARFTYTNSAIGASPGVLEIGSGVQFHQLTWNVSGSVPTCQVQLDQSADNVTWSSQIIAAQTCTSNGLSAVSTATTANYVRINITTKSGAGTVTVTYLGYTSNPGGGGSGSLTCATAGALIFNDVPANTGICDANLVWDPMGGGLGALQANADGVNAWYAMAPTTTSGVLTGNQQLAGIFVEGSATINSPNTNADAVAGILGDVIGAGSGIFGELWGSSFNASYSGTGTVVNLATYNAQPNQNTGGGTVSLNAGYQCQDQHGVSGTLNACFYAADQGTGANDYAAWFAGGKVHFGTDNSAAGTLELSNSAAAAHTIWSSAATTTNTIKGFATVPTTGHIVTCTVSGTVCTLTDGGAPGGGTAFPVTVSGTVNSGGIPCFTSTTNEASSATIAAGVLIKGGGAGACAAASSITDNATAITSAEPIRLGNGAQATPTYSFSGATGDGWYTRSPGIMDLAASGTATPVELFSGGVRQGSNGVLAFTNTSGNAALSSDTGISRDAAAVIDFGSGAASNTTARLKASGYISVGTKFTTNNGCTDSATAGGATAGTFTVGSTSCTEVVTMGDSATAPNGWSCTVVDITTLADVTNPHQTTSNGTTATFVTGTVVSGDKIQFSCIGY